VLRKESERTLAFCVYGVPQPAGSKRAFQNKTTGRIVVVDDAKGSRPWKQEVAETARQCVQTYGWPAAYRGPVSLDVTFVLPRPKGHHGTGRNDGMVKRGAPAWPAVKPDTTKLFRAVEDALTGIVYYDDALVVQQRAWKRYGTPARVEVSVRVLPVSVSDAEEAAL
jgi:Holliday junction resolvase RusA-like endonuclease